MKKLIALAVLIASTCSSIAQEPVERPVEAMDSALIAYTDGLALLDAYRGMHAAKDGNYLAQTVEELQTYYDLKMDYQYIESDLIRTQLELKPNEGIIVVDAEETGDGYVAGFRSGDLVLRVKDEPVDTQYDLVIALTNLRGSGEGSAIVRRQGQEKELVFSLTDVIVETQTRWVIGVSVDEMSEVLKSHLNTAGAVVTSVSPQSPAAKMGLRVNDIIVNIEGEGISNLEDLRNEVQKSGGKPIVLQLIRAGNKMTIEVTPQEYAEDPGVPLLRELPVISHLFIGDAVEMGNPDVVSALIPLDTPQSPNASAINRLDLISRQISDLESQFQELKKSIDK